MFDKEAINALSKAEAITAAASVINDAGAEAHVALPNDFALHDLEQHMPQRRRARGKMTTSVVKHFADYTQAHAQAGATVFVDPDTMSAEAVLNLGTPSEGAGHADNTAVLVMRKTPAYAALLSMANGQNRKQTDVAEFLEDWAPNVKCFGGGDADEDQPLVHRKAVGSVRSITIEALRKVEATEQQLAASRSAFESVAASSADPIPTFIDFTCVPYYGLTERTIRMRLGVITSEKPALTLRLINLQTHQEGMASELSELVSTAIADSMPVHIGTYAAKR